MKRYWFFLCKCYDNRHEMHRLAGHLHTRRLFVSKHVFQWRACVCLSVCLSLCLTENYWSEIDVIWCEYVLWYAKKWLNFGDISTFDLELWLWEIFFCIFWMRKLGVTGKLQLRLSWNFTCVSCFRVLLWGRVHNSHVGVADWQHTVCAPAGRRLIWVAGVAGGALLRITVYL